MTSPSRSPRSTATSIRRTVGFTDLARLGGGAAGVRRRPAPLRGKDPGGDPDGLDRRSRIEPGAASGNHRAVRRPSSRCCCSGWPLQHLDAASGPARRRVEAMAAIRRSIRAIRAHGNAVEWAGARCCCCCSSRSSTVLRPLLVHACGATLVLARLLHAFGGLAVTPVIRRGALQRDHVDVAHAAPCSPPWGPSLRPLLVYPHAPLSVSEAGLTQRYRFSAASRPQWSIACVASTRGRRGLPRYAIEDVRPRAGAAGRSHRRRSPAPGRR